MHEDSYKDCQSSSGEYTEYTVYIHVLYQRNKYICWGSVKIFFWQRNDKAFWGIAWVSVDSAFLISVRLKGTGPRTEDGYSREKRTKYLWGTVGASAGVFGYFAFTKCFGTAGLYSIIKTVKCKQCSGWYFILKIF